MKSDPYQPWLHRVAVATAIVALLPIVVGAAVTSVDAGMAFRDWPTSDGQNMFAYPWLQSAGDKFIEHGHRLAGILIGVVSICLAVLVWWREKRTWVKWAGTLVLAAVVVQGLLGGQRVLSDADVLAMVHGSFAAVVFAWMGCVALFTSRSWLSAGKPAMDHDVSHLKPLAVTTAVLVFAQYLMGGLLRHLGTALYEHLAGALLVVLSILVTAAVTRVHAQNGWLRRPAYLMVLLAVVQIALGAGAWLTKFGLASFGYVAVHHSLPQIAFRTSHTVVGMLLFMTAVNYAVRVFRADGLHRERVDKAADAAPLAGLLHAGGGPG